MTVYKVELVFTHKTEPVGHFKSLQQAIDAGQERRGDFLQIDIDSTPPALLIESVKIK